MPYRLNCIIAMNLPLIIRPTCSYALKYAGETIVLSQEQKVKIRYYMMNVLQQKFMFGVGWDPAKNRANINVDSSVAVM